MKKGDIRNWKGSFSGYERDQTKTKLRKALYRYAEKLIREIFSRCKTVREEIERHIGIPVFRQNKQCKLSKSVSKKHV